MNEDYKILVNVLKIGKQSCDENITITEEQAEKMVEIYMSSQFEHFGKFYNVNNESGTFPQLDLMDITHTVKCIFVEDGFIKAEIELLSYTPNREKIIELLNDNKLFGTCTILCLNGTVLEQVNSIDLTPSPSENLKDYPATRIL